MENKKTEEQLDKLHQETMENLYEVFEHELDAYFQYYEAALEVMGWGEGTFPFSGRMSESLNHIEKSLAAIESNLIDHIHFELKSIFDTRAEKKPKDNRHTAGLKKKLSSKIRKSIQEIILSPKESNENF